LPSNITDNDVLNGAGGGIDAQTGPGLLMTDTLVARNEAPSNPDCDGDYASGGKVIFTTIDGCADANLGPSDFVRGNVGIRRLKDNGGPTETVALRKGSFARNKATGDAPNKDQRGKKRKNPDVGAYEYR
jgi:hypothetical protein